MKLTLRSWGGFAGPAGAVTRTVDLDALPDDRAGKARALVSDARLFEQPERLLLRAPRPWDFNYVLEANDGALTRSIHLHLGAADGALRALVAWLEEEATPAGQVPPEHGPR